MNAPTNVTGVAVQLARRTSVYVPLAMSFGLGMATPCTARHYSEANTWYMDHGNRRTNTACAKNSESEVHPIEPILPLSPLVCSSQSVRRQSLCLMTFDN